MLSTSTIFLLNYTTDAPLIFNTTFLDLPKTIPEKASDFFSQPLRVISFTLCILGIVANVLSIAATANIPHGQSTHSKLIISLGASDTLILFAVLLYDIMDILSNSGYCEKVLKGVILDVALIATLVNLLVMAIDHYHAIMKPLHYRRFMSNYRGNILVTGIWTFSAFCGMLEFIVGSVLRKKTSKSFCEAVKDDDFHLDVIVIGFIFIVLLGIVLTYVRIYILVKRLMLRDRTLLHDEFHSYKAVVTTMLIIGTFTVFWAPEGIYQIYLYVCMKERDCFSYVALHFNEIVAVNEILFQILQLNSLADPLIYAVRLTEVQRGYKILYSKLFPNQRLSYNENDYRQHSFLISNGRDTFQTVVHESRSCDTLSERTNDGCYGKSSESTLSETTHQSHNNDQCDI